MLTRRTNAQRAVAIAFLTLGVGLACAHEGHGGRELGAYDLDSPRQVTPETAAHIGLETAEVDFGAIEEVLTLSGIVRAAPDRHWTISTRTAGKVLAVHVQVGDVVTKGDGLMEIDSPELARNVYEARKLEADYQKLLVDAARAQGRVQQLAVQTENTQVMADLAEAELQRAESAGESVIALNVLAEKRAAAVRAKGEAKLRVVDLAVARQEAVAVTHQAQALRLSRDALLALSNIEPAQVAAEKSPADDEPTHVVRLTAPASGVVIERRARPGHWAAAGEALLSVADYSVVQVEGELPESLISRMVRRSSDGVRVRTVSDPDYLGVGAVKFISPVLDEIKRTAHVLIETPNLAGALRDGMFVDLAIVLREENTAVVVPRSAVVQDGPVHFVFVKNGDVYRKQDITPGLSDDRVVEVLGGLAPGDIIVTQGAYSLTQLRPKALAGARK